MALVNPHGKEKKLKPLLLTGKALEEDKARAKSLTVVTMNSRETADLIMLGIGGFTPLAGFMNKAEWEGSCSDKMTLPDGTFWPIPITLSTNKGKADSIKVGQEVLLVDAETEEMMGTMKVTEKYTIDKKWECKQVFKTDEMEHPGVQMVMNQEEVNLAGPVKVWSEGPFPKITRVFICAPKKPARPSSRRAGAPWPPCSFGTPCTVPMNTWPRSPSRSATVF